MKKKMIPILALSLGLLTAPCVKADECETNDLINQAQTLVTELNQNTKDLDGIKAKDSSQKPSDTSSDKNEKGKDKSKDNQKETGKNKTDKTKPSKDEKKSDDKKEVKKDEKEQAKSDDKKKSQDNKKAPIKHNNVKTGIGSIIPTIAIALAATGAFIKSKRK